MTILIAGSNGLVGSAILNELISSGQDAVGLTRSNVNLLNRNEVFSYIQDLKPSAIIDAAAKVGGIGANDKYPVDFLTENLQIQSNLMDAAHNANVEKFVFLGSSCIYPRECPQPIKEEYLLTGPLESTNSAYALAKISGLELIKSYRKQYGKKWITVVPTNFYGPRDNFDLQNSHVLPALIRKFLEAINSCANYVELWGTGSAVREFLYVEDLAKAAVFCLENYDSSEHINIGTGLGITIKGVSVKISEILGFQGEIKWDSSKPDGMPVKVLDVSKINQLGWFAQTDLEVGIKKTLDWYKANS
jgi:GDP-L-fucose synthase